MAFWQVGLRRNGKNGYRRNSVAGDLCGLRPGRGRAQARRRAAVVLGRLVRGANVEAAPEGTSCQRATAEAAVLEPPPVSSVAVRVIPVAIELEDTVDAITAVSSAVDAGSDSTGLIEDVQHRLKSLDQAAVAVKSSPVRRARGRAESPSP